MKRIWCLCLSACVSLCLLSGAALADPAWVETEKGSLNMRRKASSKSDIVIRVPNGSEVEVLEQSGDWSRIEYKGKKGYVQSGFLRDQPPVQPEKEEPPELMIIQEGGFARISTQGGGLNLRKKMDAKSTVVGQVPNGARVAVLEAMLQWSRIEYQGKKGYVQTQYLALDSQMIGKNLYPDGAYLYVRGEKSAVSPCAAVVSAAQPMQILSIGEEWIGVSVQNGQGGTTKGYVAMKDVSLWRQAPGAQVSPPAAASAVLSAKILTLGDVLDVQLQYGEDVTCRVNVYRDGKLILKDRVLSSRVFSYRPRESGVYQMEFVLTAPDGGVIGQEEIFTVQPREGAQPAQAVYSQKDGWWLDKKYSRSNLDQSGCAIFTLSHALALLDKEAANTAPDVLARTYPMYLAESGTVTSNLLAAAGRDFGFSTGKDKLYDAREIARGFEEGAVYSFAIVSGHIALAAGLSEDGTKVLIYDSAPSVTLERIENAQLYMEDSQGDMKAVQSLWEVPDAKYYFETEQFGGLVYYLDMEYVASRGVRPIKP